MIPRLFAASLALAALLFALAGCQPEAAPPLVQVLDVTPRDAEVGDRLEILGDGFPLGKSARVTFRGSLHRPGEPPIGRAEISADAQVTSPEHLDLVFTETLESLFCGAGDRAAHTTFHGQVEVAFAAAAPGAPPVSGTLAEVTLDMRPKGLRRAVLDAQAEEGRRTLAFLGITVADALPPSGGLSIEKVAPGSKAARAGIGAGDVLARFDEVRVLSVSDVMPSGERGKARVVVRRADGVRIDSLDVSLEGYEPRAPPGLLGAAVFLTVAAAVLLLFFAPTAGALSWVERRVADSSTEAGLRARIVEGMRTALSDVLGPGAMDSYGRLSNLVLVGATLPFLVIPVVVSFFAADVDVGVLYLVAVTAVMLLAVLSGFAPDMPERGFRKAMRVLFWVLAAEVPRAVAVASVVVMAGSLRLSDIVRSQGPLPWDWFAFRQPMTLVLTTFFLAAPFARKTSRVSPLPEAEGVSRARARRSRPWLPLALAEQTHLFLMCGLGSALFLGGWRLPFAAPGEQEARGTLELLGALVFLCKAGLTTVVVLTLRGIMPRLHENEVSIFSFKLLVPLSLFAFALVATWVVFGPSHTVQRVVSGATFAAAAFCGLALVVRFRQTLRTPPARVQLNPFL
jgi:NADH-quinone oxidoreductase subunit H